MGDKRYLGHLGLIKPEVDLLRTVLRLSSRLQNRWELTDKGECDALLAYNTGKSLAPFVLKQDTRIITIRRRGEAAEGYVFYKPFRADELVDTLLAIDADTANTHHTRTRVDQPAANDVFYRLLKWPSADVLSINKNYTLLSVYLSRSPKTLADLKTLSGQKESLCMEFLQHLSTTGFVAVDRTIHTTAAKNTRSATVSAPAHKKNFFGMLKQSLSRLVEARV